MNSYKNYPTEKNRVVLQGVKGDLIQFKTNSTAPKLKVIFIKYPGKISLVHKYSLWSH